jgi:hypothetical protein
MFILTSDAPHIRQIASRVKPNLAPASRFL